MSGKTLLWQIYVAQLLLLILVLFFMGWRGWNLFSRSDPELLARVLEKKAGEIAARAAAGYPEKGLDSMICSGPEAGGDFNIILISASGKVICNSGTNQEGLETPAMPEVSLAMEGEVWMTTRRTIPDGRMMLTVGVQVVAADGAILGTALASGLLASPQRIGPQLFWEMFLGGLFFAGLAGIMAWGISRRLTGQLLEIQSTAQDFEKGKLQRRLPLLPWPEAAALAKEMNRMGASLESRFAELKQRQKEMEAVLSSMVECVLAVDGEERIFNLNPSAAELFGVPLDTAKGRYLWEVVRIPDLLRFFKRTFATSGPVEGEIELIRNTGPITLLAQGTSLRDTDGKSIGALVVLHDVTRLRKLENIRREFVANVSHELKTPITSIKGFVETLQEGALQNPEEAGRFLSIIAKQAERLNAIIDDLLNLSRIEKEAENHEITLTSSPIKPILNSALQICQVKALEKKMRICMECPDSLSVLANPPLLEQALVNLIDNAIKFSPEGGEITVEATTQGDAVTITVKDHGPGISINHQLRLFERFYRVDRARSRALGGTGLGLAIVKHITQAHGGEVSVESSLGQGSSFIINLPPAPRD